MTTQQFRYSAEETARRGDKIYEQKVRSQVEADNHNQVVAIDIETADFALGETALSASKNLRNQHPDAEI